MRVICDDNANPRILVNPVTFEGFLDSAFNEIRQSAPGNVAVVIRLLEALIRVAPFATRAEERKAIRKHAEMLDRAYLDSVPETCDRDDIARRIETLDTRLASSN